MAGTQYRAGRPSERRNTTESETVTGSNAQGPSLRCTERPYLFSPFYYDGGKACEYLALPVRQSLGRYVRCRSTVEQPLSKGCYITQLNIFLHCGGRGRFCHITLVRVHLF